MIAHWKSAGLVGVLALASCIMALAWPHAASANPFFQKQTGLQCSSCHNSGQENQGERGLNPLGRAFKSCGFKLGCDDTSHIPAPPPKPHTSEFFGGLSIFHNNCAGQQRWVAIRIHKNEIDRAMALVIEPGQSVTVAVPQGTVWAAGCGVAPTANASFQFLALTVAAPP